MSLTGAALAEMRRVPTEGSHAWEAIPFPPAGSNLNWGDRLTWDNSPITSPHGEASETTTVLVWDGKESRVKLVNGKVVYDGRGPVWPVRLEQWQHSHGNVIAVVVDKGAEDSSQHSLSIYTENTQGGLGGQVVKSNQRDYKVS
jgi:hypothetical protein